MDSSDLERLWNAVYRDLQRDLGTPVVNSWISPLSVDKFYSGVLYVKAPSMFLRDWVVNNYSALILQFCQKQNKDIKSIEIFVSSSRASVSEKSDKIVKNIEERRIQREKSDETTDFGIPLDPKFTFENFIVGKPNEFAYAAAQRVADSDKVAFNPLFLYGAVGLGKTHLMHAIAWRIKKQNPRRIVAYTSAEKFMYQFVKSLRCKATIAFKEQFRSVDVLMIDDIQFMCGKDSTQEEFFHTFNSLAANNKQIVISADKSPSDLEDLEERLKSRLGCGLVADIHPTTYELRLSILQSKAIECQAKIPDKVLEFIAHKITSNVRELEGALNRIVANAVFVGRDITVENAAEVLADLLRSSDRRTSIEEIQKKVASHYSIKLSEMSSENRSRQSALPRQVAMYLAKKLTTMSLPEIGRNFGGRNHTTVIHACRKIEELIKKDANLAEDVKLLTGVLTR
ncbi:MAG: chromosomal replication initiator protein DnaA [Holosporaceae bacterium]|jgi:chromosomal replication initiator protein|nr:chromosomal replication initiator protein DnaA [Holosporaceae bacterium]